MKVGRVTPACVALLSAVAVGLAVAATSGARAGHTSAPTWLVCGPRGFEKVAPKNDPYAFPASALRSRTGVENGSDPAAAALREYIAQELPLADPLPAHAYVVLHRTPTTVLYGHVAGRGVVNAYIFFRELGGQWQYQENGFCVPTPVFRGAITADYAIDGRPVPTARSLLVAVYLDTCGVGRAPARHVRAAASWTRHRLVLTFLITSPPVILPPRKPPVPPIVPPMIPTCAGIRLVISVRAVLPNALGHRTLFDGSVYPPVAATVYVQRRSRGPARRRRPLARHGAPPVATVKVP